MLRAQFFGDVSEQHVAVSLDALDDDVELVLFNLEGPILSRDVADLALPPKAGPRIYSSVNVFDNFQPESRQVVASVANNHFWDFGAEGAEATVRHSANSGCFLVGNSAEPVNVGSDWVVLSFTEPTFGSTSLGGELSVLGPEAFVKISELSGAGLRVIVLIHGGSEDCFLVSPRSVQTYRALCDLGATVVWATHSHVPQYFEKYGESFICYGAGNTLIDLDRWRGYEFGSVSRSMILECTTDEIRCDAFLTQQVSHRGEERLVRLSNESVISSIHERDVALKQLIDDPQLHEKVWRTYAEKWMQNYGFGAYMRGAVLDIGSRFRIESILPRMRYPLSIDSLLWPTNHELIYTGLAARYGLLEGSDDPDVQAVVALLT